MEEEELLNVSDEFVEPTSTRLQKKSHDLQTGHVSEID